ncbi:MAG: adenosine deaminase [Tepidimonas sp.]|uniref:adenosine deaminase n=1 Tax=Tepidimonas sp. TaxID=2002775 RepID=UPI00298F0956|nr:adenosine deaminase [Tepidimonas sp.]MDW8336355.1 adenosine deaminase [Tepidimonas sp.]
MIAAPDLDWDRLGGERLADLLRRAPKAELHLHIEGTLEPELMLALARRHGVRLPWASVEQVRAAYAFTSLQSFLDLYYAGAGVLRDAQDFYDLAWAYFKRAAADGVVHAECFFDPQTHTARGVPLAAVFEGLVAAQRRAAAELGLSVQWIPCILRHLSEDEALATLQQLWPWREHFIGLGLDSSEVGHPPAKFQRVFARARAEGLHCVAHAGEEGPPAYIWQALDLLQVQRIDHGVQAVHDAALLQRLARERVPLTVCPLSNVRLCVFADLPSHNLGALLQAGLCVTVNSDDPAYFGGYIADNLVQTVQALRLDARAAWQLLAHSFEAAFLQEQQRARYLAALQQAFSAAAAQR